MCSQSTRNRNKPPRIIFAVLLICGSFGLAFAIVKSIRAASPPARIVNDPYALKLEISNVFDFELSGQTYLADSVSYRGDTTTLAFGSVKKHEFELWVNRHDFDVYVEVDYFNAKSLSQAYRPFNGIHTPPWPSQLDSSAVYVKGSLGMNQTSFLLGYDPTSDHVLLFCWSTSVGD